MSALPARPPAPLRGLVLAGGQSRRMRADKALIEYHGKPQLHWVVELIVPWCSSVHVSVRADQANEPVRAGLPMIVDVRADAGPIAGILAAQQRDPDAAWLVVACDLPFLNARTLQYMIAQRASTSIATAYRSAHDALPEPLCAIWEPASRPLVAAAVEQGTYCPRSLLASSGAVLLDLPDATALDNVNTREELALARTRIGVEETPA
jgi:molybdopterin-guanine dinucleotide biosynthesis protein A